jgi:Flp pilus assembly protein TadD
MIVVLLIGLIAFYLYDVIVLQAPYTRHLFRTVAICCLLLGTLFRLNNNGRRNNLEIYEKAYVNELGAAFADRPVLRKKLLCACRLYNESNYGKALKYLSQLLRDADTEKDAVPVLFFTALCYTDIGVKMEAMQAYSELLKLDSCNAQVHSNLGSLLVDIGDFEGALEHYNRSIELKPENYYAYINRANYYFRKGEYDPAITDAKQALEFKNNGVEAASLLTVIYSLRGDENNKKHYYRLAITSGKRPSELDQAIEYFLNENRSGEE